MRRERSLPCAPKQRCLDDSGTKAVPQAEFTREMGGVLLQLHQYFSNGSVSQRPKSLTSRNMGFRLTAISSKQLERSRRNDVITDVSIARINSKLELMST